MKPSRRIAAASLALGAAFAISLPGTPAHASIIWTNDNYSGSAYGADSPANVGSLNDQASSMKNFGWYVTVFEDSGYLGRNFRTSVDYNSLGGISYNLHFGETWNDRISSWRR